MTKVDCYFSGSTNINEVIYNEIIQAKIAVFVAMYTLTNKTLINGLIELRKKGIEVLSIFDHLQAIKYSDLIFQLMNSEIECKTTGGDNFSMHNKFIIIDGIKVITGSFNWTERASRNVENIVIIEDHQTSLKFLNEFNSIWEAISSQHYKQKLSNECYNKLQNELKQQEDLSISNKLKKLDRLEKDNEFLKMRLQRYDTIREARKADKIMSDLLSKKRS